MEEQVWLIKRGRLKWCIIEPFHKHMYARLALTNQDDTPLGVDVYMGRDQPVVVISNWSTNNTYLRGIIEGGREFMLRSGHGLVLKFKGENGKRYRLKCDSIDSGGTFMLTEHS